MSDAAKTDPARVRDDHADEGVTRTSILGTHALLKLVREVENGSHKTLVVEDVDRMRRDSPSVRSSDRT